MDIKTMPIIRSNIKVMRRKHENEKEFFLEDLCGDEQLNESSTMDVTDHPPRSLAKLSSFLRGNRSLANIAGERRELGGRFLRSMLHVRRRSDPAPSHGSMSCASSDSGSISGDSTDGYQIEKHTMGIKINLGRVSGDKKALEISLDRGDIVCKIDVRRDDTVDKVRSKIEKGAKGKIPIAFRFCYSDGIPVEFYKENTTRIQSCLDKDGSLSVFSPKALVRRNPQSFVASPDRISQISSDAESVVRHSLRLIEAFETDTDGQFSLLPSALQSTKLFFRDVGRATLDIPSNTILRWQVVESLLKEIEGSLKTHIRRQKFVALMSYRSDVDHIGACVKKIQKEFLQAKVLNDDHPVFFVKIDKPSSEIENLLNTLAKTTFLDLCGEKHARTRRLIAEVLNVTETEVVESIQNKGITTVFQQGMFHNSSKPLVRVNSYTSLKDIDALKTLLAPNIDSQRALISNQAACFNQKTNKGQAKEFDSWSRGINSVHRCFLLCGSPASGKTTLISHLIKERAHIIIAAHYCQHDDVATTDPKVMLLSITYQLCLHSISFESKIRSLLIKKRMTRKQLLGQSYPIATLFRDFLEIPLQSLDISDKNNHCIVIDGIDLANEGASQRNPILKAIRSYLTYLPPWIRLVVTTRRHLSILKGLRPFNAKMIEPKEDDIFDDFYNLFDDALQATKFDDASSCRYAAEMLANTTKGNYVHASILMSKARDAEVSDIPNLLTDTFALDFESILENDLELAVKTEGELFWILVRMSLAAFRPLKISDVVALTGCSKKDLEKLLAKTRTFFELDGTIIRFVHNVVKCWLLARLNVLGSPQRINVEKLSCSSTLRAKMTNEIKSCHREIAEGVLMVLSGMENERKLIFADSSIKELMLQYGVNHCVSAGMIADAKHIVLDPTWIMERSTDIDGILDDLDAFSEDEEIIQLVKRATILSIPAVKKDPRQIVSQLVGRLKATAGEGYCGDRAVKHEVQNFVERLEKHDYGIEWWCPVAATWDKAEQTLVRKLTGHDGQVQSVHLHPNNRLCASASWDQNICVWDISSGVCEGKFRVHTDVIWSIDWNSSGDKLLSASSDKTAQVTKFPTGETDLVLQGHTDNVFSARFCPDSSLIATGSKDSTIRIWHAQTGECLQVLHCDDSFVYCLDWRPESQNRYLCSGGTDNVVRIWDLEQSVCSMIFSGHRDWVRSVAWSANGMDVFSGSTDQTVICWDGTTGECDQVLMGHTGGVSDVAQSEDGRYVFSSSVDGTVKIWECSTWRCDQTLIGHTGPVLSIAVSADGGKLLSGGSDNTLIEWDCEVERTVSDLDDHTTPVWGVDISPDERYVLSASTDHTARLWNIANGIAERIFAGHTGPVWKAKFNHSGKKVATASSDNTAAIYRVSTAGRILELPHEDAVWDIAWSIDDQQLYTASRDHVIRCWCAKTGQCEVLLKGHTKDVKSISVSRDGKRLASGSSDGTIRIWNLSTNKNERIFHGSSSGVLSVDWCPDNICVNAGYTTGCVWLWNIQTGEREISFLPGHTRRANAVSCSPDGLRIASASTDKEIRIWNVESKTCERRIAAGIGLGVFCVKYISGNRVISGGADRTIRVWNAENGRCETVMAGVTGLGIYDVAFSPDENLVASGSRDRTVQIWDTETGKCVKTFKGHTNWVHSVDWDCTGKRIMSQSDDGTSRVWDVESGDCLEIAEKNEVPKGFIVGSAANVAANLSPRAGDGNPIGVQCDKVKICGDRACGWIGKTVFFFKLHKSEDLNNSMAQIDPEDLPLLKATDRHWQCRNWKKIKMQNSDDGDPEAGGTVARTFASSSA